MSYNTSQAVLCDPVADTDGDLAGYRFYAGTAPRTYSVTSSSTGPSATLSGLSKDVLYYFGSTAFDTSNNESTWSNEISKTITLTVLQLVRQVK